MPDLTIVKPMSHPGPDTYTDLVDQEVQKRAQRQADLQEAHAIARRGITRLGEILDARQDLTIEELSDLAQALFSYSEVLKM